MRKSSKYTNALMKENKIFQHAENQRFSFIKRKKLVELMKKRDIKRFNKKALWLLEQKLGEDLDKYIEFLARKLMIEGRKTLKEGDIKDLKNALEKKEKEGFEI